MARAARRELSRTDTAAPDMGALLRTFEADLRGAEKPRFSRAQGGARAILRAVRADSGLRLLALCRHHRRANPGKRGDAAGGVCRGINLTCER